MTYTLLCTACEAPTVYIAKLKKLYIIRNVFDFLPLSTTVINRHVKHRNMIEKLCHLYAFK